MALKKSVTTVSLIRVSSMVVWSWPGTNTYMDNAVYTCIHAVYTWRGKKYTLFFCGSHLKHLRVMGLEKSVTGEYSLVPGLLMITGWGSFGRLSHGSPWSASPVLFSTSSAQLVKQHHQMVLMMITIFTEKMIVVSVHCREEGCIGKYDLCGYHPCCMWISRNTSLRCDSLIMTREWHMLKQGASGPSAWNAHKGLTRQVKGSNLTKIISGGHLWPFSPPAAGLLFTQFNAGSCFDTTRQRLQLQPPAHCYPRYCVPF